MATLLIEANVNLALISQWLGHSLVTTTRLYGHPTAEGMAAQISPVTRASLVVPEAGLSA